MLQELSDESRQTCHKTNIKYKGDCCEQNPNQRGQCDDRKCLRLRIFGTTTQPQGKEPGQNDTTKNHGRLGGTRQTLGCLQKLHCHLPEETGVQLMCAASYGIWCNMDTHQTSTEQTCGSTSHTSKERPTSGSGRGQKS